MTKKYIVVEKKEDCPFYDCIYKFCGIHEDKRPEICPGPAHPDCPLETPSWDTLMAILDDIYPEDIFPTLPDNQTRDPGPRIISLLRRLYEKRTIIEKLKEIAVKDRAHLIAYAEEFTMSSPDMYDCVRARAQIEKELKEG